jgi:[ribosomal protein S18]-alanine N-acetyltransferase
MATITITPLTTTGEAETCAEMMAESEPWITLRRYYTESFRTLTDPNYQVYLAKESDNIAGFIITEHRGPLNGYIKSICVNPKYRNKGIGTMLIQDAEKRIFKDTPNVFLLVSDFNEGARRLYRRLGYQKTGELDYLIEGSSEILMRKTQGPLIRG